MFISEGHLVLDFPFDRSQVDELKKIAGSKWDKVNKVWRVPITSIEETRSFALKHQFTIENDVLTFNTPQRKLDRSVSLDDDWILLRFPYERVIIKAVKQIPSITWSANKRAWQAPKTSVKEVVEWAESFEIPVSSDVLSMKDDVLNKLSELIEDSRSVDAEINVPNLHGELLPYQRAGVKYASRAKRAFIADEMGLGKTIQAISTLQFASLVSNPYPAVVVCPPSLVLNWKAEYARWLPSLRVATVSNRKELPKRDSYDVLVIGYSNITHWENQLLNHSSYVFDESHYCKTMTAKRTKSAIKMAKSAPKDGNVLCLTGTPVTNRPAEYASQLEILGKLKDFGGLWGFYRRYCNAYQDNFGQWNISGHSNLDELNEKLRGTCYIRRTKDQVLSELPPVIHNPIIVEGIPAQMAEYNKAEKDIINYLMERARQIAEELGKSPTSAAVVAKIKAESNEHLVRLSVLRRLSAKAKMPIVEEWVKERIEAGKKVVIAAHHREIVDELAKKFGGLKIQGGMDVADVEANKEKFQNLPVDKAPVIVLSIQAAKTGHTLTSAQDCLFVELPWTPADLDQTFSRLHRIGQKGSVTSTYMLTAGTIDEEIYNLIEKKRKVVNVAIDGGDPDGLFSPAEILFGFISKSRS